jgi:hypothetical protein
MAQPTDNWEWQDHEAEIERGYDRADARARGVIARCDWPVRHRPIFEPDDLQLFSMYEEHQNEREYEMALSDYYKSESTYLKADDLREGAEVRLTISKVQVEVIDQDGGKKEVAVVYFSGKEKGLVLNATNGSKITGAYGDSIEAVTGKEVILYRDTTEFKGKTVPCLRVRIPSQEVDAEDIPF